MIFFYYEVFKSKQIFLYLTIQLLKEGAYEAGGRTDSAARGKLYLINNKEFFKSKIFWLLTRVRASEAIGRRDSQEEGNYIY